MLHHPGSEGARGVVLTSDNEGPVDRLLVLAPLEGSNTEDTTPDGAGLQGGPYHGLKEDSLGGVASWDVKGASPAFTCGVSNIDALGADNLGDVALWRRRDRFCEGQSNGGPRARGAPARAPPSAKVGRGGRGACMN